ncbi:MAG: NUDIX hydrolase [Clostridia bacterium]|nr:NUDIX hydrolase [Clostridia bacterium]
MTYSKSKLTPVIENLDKFIPFCEQEANDKEVMLELATNFSNSLTRENKFGHFTASAFVVNEDFTKTLLVHHNIFGGYIFPGGHADGESDLLGVALREVKEETNVNAIPVSEDIFAIGADPIAGHIKKGVYVPAHIHYDILYLVVVKNEDMKNIQILESENSNVIWRDIDECYNSTDLVSWAKPQIQKIITKLRSYEMNYEIKELYTKINRENQDFSLDEVLYAVFEKIKNDSETFDELKPIILQACDIDEFKYYTSNVDPALKKYITENVFPQYEINDKAHGIVHIKEVIRRSFALNETFKLGLDHNLIYAIASYHDLGKHEDHKNHHLIAGQRFICDENLKRFFTDTDRAIGKEAIEDHRSSKEDDPRSIYGELISSADRNTTIDMVFIRSFFVAKERMPEMQIEEYLDYTIERLAKKYSEENPENMFFEDTAYLVFLKDMRELLSRPEEFKERYCKVNHIKDRTATVDNFAGETNYFE